jgi:hypothetical protein
MAVDASHFKEKVLEEVSRFPEDKLTELYDIIRHLRLGMEVAVAKDEENSPVKRKSTTSGSAFLLSIAGIGTSRETDISEHAEEILAQEIDPIRGWGLDRDSAK